MGRAWTRATAGRLRPGMLLAGGVMLAAMVAGILSATGLPEPIRRQVESSLVLPVEPPPPGPEYLPAALRRNLLEGAALAWFLGLSLLGLPLLWGLLFWRGFQLGFAAAFVWQWSASSRHQTLLSLIPHNLVALPGLALLVVALGRLSYELLKSVWRGRPLPRPRLAALGGLAVAATLVLVGASYVEAYVTPRLVELALQLWP